jgi:hypothetical protein
MDNLGKRWAIGLGTILLAGYMFVPELTGMRVERGLDRVLDNLQHVAQRNVDMFGILLIVFCFGFLGIVLWKTGAPSKDK